jgi:hypothetical protein
VNVLIELALQFEHRKGAQGRRVIAGKADEQRVLIAGRFGGQIRRLRHAGPSSVAGTFQADLTVTVEAGVRAANARNATVHSELFLSAQMRSSLHLHKVHVSPQMEAVHVLHQVVVSQMTADVDASVVGETAFDDFEQLIAT